MGVSKTKFFIGILLTIITSLEIIGASIYSSNIDCSNIILEYYSYFPTTLEGSKMVMEILLATINVIYTVYIFFSNIYTYIFEKGIYIFTRTKNINKLIIKEYLKVGKNLLIYYIFQILIFNIFIISMGVEVSNIYNYILYTILSLLSIWLGTYILIILASLVSLYFNEIVGFIVSISLFVTNIIGLNILHNYSKLDYIRYFPFTQYLITLHDEIFINRNFFDIYVSGYKFIYSLIYIAIIMLIIIFLSIRRIKKIDIY